MERFYIGNILGYILMINDRFRNVRNMKLMFLLKVNIYIFVCIVVFLYYSILNYINRWKIMDLYKLRICLI